MSIYAKLPKKYAATWARMSLAYRLRNPWCAMCLTDGHGKVQGTVVDHIKPHRGDASLLFDVHNLQTLCAKHHNSTKQKQERRGFSIQADSDGNPLDPNHPWNKLKHRTALFARVEPGSSQGRARLLTRAEPGSSQGQTRSKFFVDNLLTNFRKTADTPQGGSIPGGGGQKSQKRASAPPRESRPNGNRPPLTVENLLG